MEIKIEPKTSWSDVRDAARATMWRLPDGKEPTSEWKRKILLARHSPIEALVFKVTMKDIPYWVSVHLVRHKVGITHWVSSQRDDRHENEVPRAEMPQGALVTHTMQINAQALISDHQLKKRIDTVDLRTGAVVPGNWVMIEGGQATPHTGEMS